MAELYLAGDSLVGHRAVEVAPLDLEADEVCRIVSIVLLSSICRFFAAESGSLVVIRIAFLKKRSQISRCLFV